MSPSERHTKVQREYISRKFVKPQECCSKSYVVVENLNALKENLLYLDINGDPVSKALLISCRQ